ncbi:unnamed protein product [Boreogadus saida]
MENVMENKHFSQLTPEPIWMHLQEKSSNEWPCSDTGKYSLGQQTNLTIPCKERLQELGARALFVDLGSLLVSHFPDGQRKEIATL